MVKTAGDEPWMDMNGNLQEAVTKRNETTRFDYRGYGVEYGSITAPPQPGIHASDEERRPRRTLHALQVALEADMSRNAS